MVLILISTVFIIPILMGIGNLMEKVFKSLLPGISGKILLGIMGVSLSWTIISFFIPLNIYVEVPVILLGLFYFFKNKLYHNFYEISKKDTFLIAIISVVTIGAGSYYPYILDHFGYYVPTIKWLTDRKSVV